MQDIIDALLEAGTLSNEEAAQIRTEYQPIPPTPIEPEVDHFKLYVQGGTFNGQ